MREALKTSQQALALADKCIDQIKVLTGLGQRLGLTCNPPAVLLSHMGQPDQVALRLAGESAGVGVSDAIDALDADLAQAGRSESHRSRCIETLRDVCSSHGWTELASLNPDNVTRWMTELGARNGGKTRNLKRSYMHRLCDLCVRRGWLTSNPVRAVTKARVIRKVSRRVPTEEEVAGLIQAARSDWRKKDRWLVYLVAASTGLRWGTLKAVEWVHVRLDAEPAYLDIPGHLLKGREPRVVWLTHECARCLREHRGDKSRSGRVFVGVPKWDGFLRDCRKAGIERGTVGETPTLSFHSLRHFASNRLLWAGQFSDQDRAAQAGHATLDMTRQVYTDPGAAGLGRKIHALPGLLQGVVKAGQKSKPAHPKSLLRTGGSADSLPLSQQHETRAPVPSPHQNVLNPDPRKGCGPLGSPAVTSREGLDSSRFGSPASSSIGVGGFEPQHAVRDSSPDSQGERARAIQKVLDLATENTRIAAEALRQLGAVALIVLFALVLYRCAHRVVDRELMTLSAPAGGERPAMCNAPSIW